MSIWNKVSLSFDLPPKLSTKRRQEQESGHVDYEVTYFVVSPYRMANGLLLRILLGCDDLGLTNWYVVEKEWRFQLNI